VGASVAVLDRWVHVVRELALSPVPSSAPSPHPRAPVGPTSEFRCGFNLRAALAAARHGLSLLGLRRPTRNGMAACDATSL